MQKYQSTITATNGSVIRNVPVTVLKEDGSLAEIFMDREGQVQAPNPLVTDSRGVFYFYAKNGRYSLRTAADGVQITDADTVLLFDPDETASDGPIADAVRRAEDAAERAETALGDSGLQNMVQDAQDAAANAAQAVIDAHQAVASIDAALIEVSEAKEDAQAAAQTASNAASDAQAVKDSLLNYDGTLSATPEWSAVPAHEDSNLDAQTQAALNRIEKLKDDQQLKVGEVIEAEPSWSDVPKHKSDVFNAQAQALANRTAFLKDRVDAIPDEVDAAGTAEQKVDEHNRNPNAHPEMHDFISAEANRAEAARDAAIATAGPLYATIEEGRAAVADGETFAVQGSGATAAIIYRRTSESASTKLVELPSKSAIDTLDALRVNAGKDYPLKQMTRAGVTSPVNSVWNALLLDVKVHGAEPGKLYRLQYQRNDYNDSGWGWIITEHDESTYETTDSGYVQINSYLSVGQPSIDRSGGVQTITVTPQYRPWMRFVITLDAGSLPPKGQVVGGDSWTWVINPACYFKVVNPSDLPYLNSATINAGKTFPFLRKTRGGITSSEQFTWNNWLLDVKVHGAVPGKFYKIAWFQNEAVLANTNGWHWVIQEFDSSSFESSGVDTIIHRSSDESPAIVRNGGLQLVSVKPKLRPSMRFDITIDGNALPTAGTAVNSYSSSGALGWSYIIDPICYVISDDVNPVASWWDGSGVRWIIDTDGLTVMWREGEKVKRLVFGKKGPNQLPDIKSLYFADWSFESEPTAWTQIMDTSSGGDFIPPFIFRAVNDGDGGARIYTGGNHGSDGNVGGVPTARNISFMIMPDGQHATTGSGFAKYVQVLIVNEIMAYNTITLDRYPLRQIVKCFITAGSLEIENINSVTENVEFEQDNGPQTITNGFKGTQLFLGKLNSRGVFNSTANSGSKSANPDVWGVSFKDPSNGQLVAWMDREYEAGDGRYVPSNSPFIRGGGASNQKFYHAVIVNMTVPLSAGASYRWRGGWAWQPVQTGLSDGVDGAVQRTVGGVSVCDIVLSDGQSI